ncbi:MAG: excinuclease ABC subunit C [Gammaproteobacteria bacterium]|nr:MAG: excinuclease ABC subunit C [Gammaproteobacteria bacterium]
MQNTSVNHAFDVKAFLKTLTNHPGVYQMLDEFGEVLYVGKASNLKNRVSSYFRATGLAPKTRSLVAKIRNVSITITNSDTEALLLEQNLIKTLSPPYNILLRDDKSYPYIFLPDGQKYPSLVMKRVRHKGKGGTFFGPYPSASAVKDSLSLLQKIFKIRQCEDSFFNNRSRPCLQYQINRCSAPCVGAISEQDYQEDMHHAILFLQGKNPALIQKLMQNMQQASEKLEFEKAAIYRDQIAHLRHVQESQSIEAGNRDADVIYAAIKSATICVHVIFVRGGRVVGSKNYFPKISIEQTEEEMMESFLSQFYIGGHSARDIPVEIIVNLRLSFVDSFKSALKQSVGKSVSIKNDVIGDRQKWLSLAEKNARHSLDMHLSNKDNLAKRYSALASALGLDDMPSRIECFDVSHSSGESTVASCVVFGLDGAIKSDYRIYNIAGITAGDDYAAMQQALDRRYRKRRTEGAKLPDILLIDGGKGQLTSAKKVLEELQITDVSLLGVAKGPSRRPGLEIIIDAYSGQEYVFDDHPSGLLLIQQIRDEAHRFAITGHRHRRDKKRARSRLEDIPGLGPKRRKNLIHYFGGVQAISRASVQEIAKVAGISQNLAQSIYQELHQE